jgi:hypothetical protein
MLEFLETLDEYYRKYKILFVLDLNRKSREVKNPKSRFSAQSTVHTPHTSNQSKITEINIIVSFIIHHSSYDFAFYELITNFKKCPLRIKIELRQGLHQKQVLLMDFSKNYPFQLWRQQKRARIRMTWET